MFSSFRVNYQLKDLPPALPQRRDCILEGVIRILARQDFGPASVFSILLKWLCNLSGVSSHHNWTFLDLYLLFIRNFTLFSVRTAGIDLENCGFTSSVEMTELTPNFVQYLQAVRHDYSSCLEPFSFWNWRSAISLLGKCLCSVPLWFRAQTLMRR